MHCPVCDKPMVKEKADPDVGIFYSYYECKCGVICNEDGERLDEDGGADD